MDWKLSPTAFTQIQRIYFFSLAAVAILLPWNGRITYLAIVITTVAWVLLSTRQLGTVTRQAWLEVLLIGSLFLIQLIGMLYTHNLSEARFRVETKITLLVFPLIIITSNLRKEQINNIIFFFSVSTVFACLWCDVVAVRNVLTAQDPLAAMFTDLKYQSLMLASTLDFLHPTYLSIFCCIAIAQFFLFNIPYVSALVGRIIKIVFIAFLVIFILQLTSLVGFVSLLITSGGIIFYLLRKHLALLALTSIILIGVSAIVVVNVPGWRTRVVEAFSSASLTKDDTMNSISMHYKSWYCTYSQWKQGNILWGRGTGDEKDLVRACYQENHWTDLGHDAHNEYLSALIRHGLIGLAILLTAIFVPLWLSWRERNYPFALFILMMMVSFCAESVFRAGIGPIFFSFFMSLWLTGQHRPATAA